VTSETAVLRVLTFEAPSVVIEVGHTPGGIVGQLVPPAAGTAWLHTAAGETPPVEIVAGLHVVTERILL
jgi:hypothetical protein